MRLITLRKAFDGLLRIVQVASTVSSSYVNLFAKSIEEFNYSRLIFITKIVFINLFLSCNFHNWRTCIW